MLNSERQKTNPTMHKAIKFFVALFLAVTSWGQSNSGSALKLTGTDFVRAYKQVSGTFANKDIAFEFWFRARSPGALVGEADAADTTQWDTLIAELLSNGMIAVGFSGVPTIFVGPVRLSEWHHLVISYDQTSQVLSTYLDDQPGVFSA